jgi:hypothetical protein
MGHAGGVLLLVQEVTLLYIYPIVYVVTEDQCFERLMLKIATDRAPGDSQNKLSKRAKRDL